VNQTAMRGLVTISIQNPSGVYSI